MIRLSLREELERPGFVPVAGPAPSASDDVLQLRMPAEISLPVEVVRTLHKAGLSLRQGMNALEEISRGGTATVTVKDSGGTAKSLEALGVAVKRQRRSAPI